MKAICGMVVGTELAIVHMATILETKGVASKKDIAASYRATAANIGQGVQNRDIVVMILDHIAAGIDGQASAGDPGPFLRLILGGKQSDHPGQD
ncbi:MAG: hypothetical protein AB1413_12560 [Thermodesulfobacteriota bacterium]